MSIFTKLFNYRKKETVINYEPLKPEQVKWLREQFQKLNVGPAKYSPIIKKGN